MNEDKNQVQIVYEKVNKLDKLTNSELRLMMGEMTSQEIRNIRAILNYILSKS